MEKEESNHDEIAELIKEDKKEDDPEIEKKQTLTVEQIS